MAGAGKARKRWRVALIAVASVLALALGAAGVYALTISASFDTQTKKLTRVFPEETTRPEEPEGEAAKAQNILLLGSDTRGSIGDSLDTAGGSRSDTIMIVHIPAERDGIQVMSIMRDCWLEIPGHGEAKVNATLALGGVPLVVQTVEGLIGSRIDHVAIVDFEGFRGVTEALGGVEIDNPIGFNSFHMPGRYFQPGPQHMNADEALAFVRERHAFRDGDYQRVRNQQAFIKAVLDKTLSVETLTNPVRIGNLVGAIAPYLAVDEGLDSVYIAGLGFELREVGLEDVKFFTMPTLGIGAAGNQSIVKVDWAELEVVKNAFRNDALDRYDAQVQTIP